MSDVTLRSATEGDVGAIEGLLVANKLPTIGARESVLGFIVAEHRARVVGVVGLETCGEFALLRSAAVDEAWRGRGVGRLLVERAIAAARVSRIRSLYLLTTTAERYFPSFGFTVTARESVPDAVRETAEFRTACPASATVMTLSLS